MTEAEAYLEESGDQEDRGTRDQKWMMEENP